MNARSNLRDRVMQGFATLTALAGLGGVCWPWEPVGFISRCVDALRLPVGMIVCALVLLGSYQLASGPMFAPTKPTYALFRSSEEQEPLSDGRKPFHPDDDEGDSLPSDAGKPAPLRPRPGQRLVAAKALPPGESTYVLPKD